MVEAQPERPFYLRNGNWVTCGVVGLLFPKEAIEIEYRGQTLVLIPGAKQKDDRFGNIYPMVALDVPGGMSFEDGQRLIAAFLSSVAWVKRAPIQAAMWSGGNLPRPLGGKDARIETDDRFALDYLPEPVEERTKVALALYREGLTLNNIAYQCLSLFKVLNLVEGGGPAQIAWIDANWQAASNIVFGLHDWVQRANLQPGQTVGNYLYATNRCAVAHANSNPTAQNPMVDPDDPSDRQRLTFDWPMVKALIEYLIENTLGVKSDMTVFREHLYELDGFKALFGPDLVARIIAGEEVAPAVFPALPAMSVRLAHESTYPPLERMAVTVADCADGTVGLMLDSPEGLTTLLLGLDFRNERVEFSLAHGIATEDDGTRRAALDHASVLRFRRRYIGNGCLEVWTQGRRISRKDAYLPENIDLGFRSQMEFSWID
jgi:hypothetical protein